MALFEFMGTEKPCRQYTGRMSRALRIFAALVALVSVMAAQLAVSAHPCREMVRLPIPGDGLVQSDDGRFGAACGEHCRAESANLDTGKAAADAIPLQGPAFRIPAFDAFAAAAQAALRRAPLPPEPPAAIRFAVLRL